MVEPEKSFQLKNKQPPRKENGDGKNLIKTFSVKERKSAETKTLLEVKMRNVC